jgi:hypothetical protein
VRIIREPKVRRTSAVGSRYQATNVKTTDLEDLVRAVVNFRVRELARTL